MAFVMANKLGLEYHGQKNRGHFSLYEWQEFQEEMLLEEDDLVPTEEFNVQMLKEEYTL